MLADCENCYGTGRCPVCYADGDFCSWCDDGACPDCGGSGTFICEEVE
jgi:hypothetical protein